jgi:excisionase family DNA binding protein
MEKLWTTTEVAAFLGVNEREVERLVKDGTLMGYKLGGQFLRFRPDQVQAMKGKVSQPAAPRAILARAARAPLKDSWFGRVQDFFYFYDFYLVSALLLAVLMVYLVVS